MTMSTYITITPSKKQNVSVPLENFLSASSSQLPPTPDKGKHSSNSYHRLLVLSVPELHINYLGSTLFFLAFPSTHYVVFETLLCVSISLFLIAEYYSLFHDHSTVYSFIPC